LSDHISWFRILNKSSSDETSLLEVNDSLKAPVTTVEDSLNGALYREALLKLRDELPSDVHHFISTSQPRNEFIPSVSLNFNIEIQRSLKEWFEHHLYGNKRKFDVAKAYVESMSTEEYAIPNWILKIQEKLTRK
ncbi:hypothetical protein ACUUY8_24990, partial [Klebsiella pneumoniae]